MKFLAILCTSLALGQLATPVSTMGRTALVGNRTTLIGTGPSSRQGISVQNLSATELYCGWVNRLTDGGVSLTDGGTTVAADGGSLLYDLGFKVAASQVATFEESDYKRSWSDLACMTPATQTSPLDTRWSEAR